MKAATLFILAIVSIWFTDAMPFPPLQGHGGERGRVIQSSDGPSSTYAGQMQQDEDEPREDEEEINERNGFARLPNVFGDVVLTPEQMKQVERGYGEGTAQAFFIWARPWPNAVLPYKISDGFGPRTTRLILAAMNELSARTCLQFVKVTDGNSAQYPNYVRFFPGSIGACYSSLGMVGGKQDISIGRGCGKKGIIQHEIFHALGRLHEQSRPDRNQYVTINWHNIEPNRGFERNFRILPSDTQNLPYDYGSIMHYGPGGFSKFWGDPDFYTIVPKQPGVEIGQRDGLSATDWMHIKKAYCSKRSKRDTN